MHIIILSFLAITNANASDTIKPVRTTTPPVLDGILDDAIWQTATQYSDFITIEPDFGKKLSEVTYIQAAYDDNYLYFAFRCFDSQPDQIKASVTKWDNMFQEDWVAVALDALNDKQGAILFAANALGSQGDILMDANGEGNGAEDYVWDAAGIKDDEGFSVEFSIPLQTLRYNAGDVVEMGIAFLRNISRSSEKATFPEITPEGGSLTQQFATIRFENLTYTRYYEVLPSLTVTSASSRDDVGVIVQNDRRDPGITAKVGLTSTLTMDLTYNPDFSQVESDVSQVDINTRVPVTYPEKRPFFLETAKSFAIAGAGDGGAPIRKVVYTRAIADPRYGVAISGKLGKSNSISVLVSADESPVIDDPNNPDANFAIMRYKRLLEAENYVGAIFTNRSFKDERNTVGGVDMFKRLNGTTTLSGHALFSNSEVGGIAAPAAHAVAANINYGTRDWMASASFNRITKDFRIDMGDVPRDGTQFGSIFGGRNWYYEHPILQKITLGSWAFYRQDLYWNIPDYGANIFTNIGLTRSTNINTNYEYSYEVYQDSLFSDKAFNFSIQSQLLKSLFIVVSFSTSESPFYDPDDPGQARSITRVAFMLFQPTDKISTELQIVNSKLSLDGKEMFTAIAGEDLYNDYTSIRSKTTYQLNKFLFIRGIVQYVGSEDGGELKKSLTTEALLSFTYFPGTVLYLGYGSQSSNLEYSQSALDYILADKYLEMKRGLFFKASYNLRI